MTSLYRFGSSRRAPRGRAVSGPVGAVATALLLASMAAGALSAHAPSSPLATGTASALPNDIAAVLPLGPAPTFPGDVGPPHANDASAFRAEAARSPRGVRPHDPLDSARAEVARGRYFRAVTILRDFINPANAAPDVVLLLAEAEAGRRNWEGVRELLSGRSWLGAEDAGRGLYLLGRAQAAAQDWGAAAVSFDDRIRALRSDQLNALPVDAPSTTPVVGTTPLPEDGALTRPDPVDPLESAARAALATGRASPGTLEVVQAIRRLAEASAPVASWVALELARPAASAGELEAVEILAPLISDPNAALFAWDLEPRAELARGDTAAAIEGYRALAMSDGRPGAWASLGELELSTGNRDSAAVHFRRVLELDDRSGPAVRAALGLVGIGESSGEESLQLARILQRGGETRAAIRAWDRALEALGGVAILDADERLGRAELLADGGRADDAVAEFQALSVEGADPDIGARALASWARLRRSQGRTEDVRTLEQRLTTRFPATPQAADVHFFRADASHDRDALEAARTGYAATMESARSSDRGGLAAMRLGQLHLRGGDPESAYRVWVDYLDAFPTGRRWGEAQYWAARSALMLGDSAEWSTRLDSIPEREPFTYYAVLASEDRGRRFAPQLPPGPVPGEMPSWMSRGLVDLLVLDRIGLTQASGRILDDLVARAEPEPEHSRLLGEALVAHGRPLDGINIGWSLLGDGEPWSMRIVRLVYPFPFSDLVRQEAAEKGLDPALLAGLIRQESAFVPDIVSAAGARGLTQVMPATGRELARSTRIEGYSDESLFSAETNLLLGTHFLVELGERYAGDLHLILSAYNAGPSRADAWRRFEEASDPLRYTERIPFTETRGYVKNIIRNRAIYAWLWAAPST